MAQHHDGWTPVDSPPPLGKGEIHVWRLPLSQDGGPPDDEARALLSPDERRRAARMVRPGLQQRFVRVRSALRRLLGSYAGLPPGSLPLVYGPQGKPALDPGALPSAPAFNLSHTRGLALLAFGRVPAVGVDVEALRPRSSAPKLVERFFAPEEASAFRALPGEESLPAFFRAWTRKEALAKALGTGLLLVFRDFAVPLDPAPARRVTRAGGPAAPLAGYRLRDLAPGPGWIGALAWQGAEARVRLWEEEP